MRRIGRVLMAVAAGAVAAQIYAADRAYAADMAPAPGYYPPAAAYRPALYDWTGFYFGGHVGAGYGVDTVTQTTTTSLLAAGTATHVNPVGVLGGGQIGANYEFAPWVVGIEGSFTSSALTGSASTTTLSGPVSVTERATSNPQWLAAATGRFGYAANTLLIYAKGGVAWMHAEYTQDTLSAAGGGGAGIVFATQSLNNTRTGFVAGAGLEYGMTENFSAKLEYDFYDFGSANYTFNVADPNTLAAVVMPVSIKSDIHVLTVGLNYRLNWAGGWH